MKQFIYGIASLTIVGMLSGCQTTGWEQQRQQEQRLASEVAELRISMQRMEHRLADMAREQDALGEDVQLLRQNVREQTARNESVFTSLSSRLDEQVRSQTALRRELTEDLSTRMAEVLRTQQRAAPATRASGRTRAEVGYEHEVQSGETLSEIARAYGVSSQDIMQANQLRDPNVLRVGQTLFIPAR